MTHDRQATPVRPPRASASTALHARSKGHEILARMRAGDTEALGDFYDLFAGLANGLALRILRDRAEAEDVVQEVFVQIWRQVERFDAERGSPQAWVCTITRSRALDRLRRRGARREESDEGLPAGGDTPRHAEAVAVRAALLELPLDQRQALELAYYEGLSQSEIAERLSTPLGTIKTRIRTGMQRLRARLEPLA